MIRKPAVADQFYPGNPEELERMVTDFEKSDITRENAVALIAPHAGYIYSGRVAGAVYSAVNIADDIVLIGPNHTGQGREVALMAEGAWEMPADRVDVNGELAALLLEETPLLTSDAAAHLREHSLEVQLPFIRHFNRAATVVPIVIKYLAREQCATLGRAIARAIERYEERHKKRALIVVSSDMNHYESQEVTEKKDGHALEKLLALDGEGLLATTERENITMCGVVPAAVAIAAAKELGATSAKLVEYATSAETSGDYDHVVGYAGVVIQ